MVTYNVSPEDYISALEVDGDMWTGDAGMVWAETDMTYLHHLLSTL